MIVSFSPKGHPNNPRIRPTSRTLSLSGPSSLLHFVSVNITLVPSPRSVKQVHPHKRRNAKLRRMQALRRVTRDQVVEEYRCPDPECKTGSLARIELGLFYPKLVSNITCNCGKPLIRVQVPL